MFLINLDCRQKEVIIPLNKLTEVQYLQYYHHIKRNKTSWTFCTMDTKMNNAVPA